jgi:hypothetical protein
MINRHVFKGGGVDVGIQAIFMAINHCVDPVSKNKLGFWYKYTVLEKITGIKAEKLNAQNLCTALDFFYPDGKDKAVEMEKVVSKVKESDIERLFAVSNNRLGSDRYGIGWMEGLKPIYLCATFHIY